MEMAARNEWRTASAPVKAGVGMMADIPADAVRRNCHSPATIRQENMAGNAKSPSPATFRKENMAGKAKSPSPATIRQEDMAEKAKSPSPATIRYGNLDKEKW